jgi:DMSO/TMAO reductase YedYZ molybdopterin-dependent catalytic subunit
MALSRRNFLTAIGAVVVVGAGYEWMQTGSGVETTTTTVLGGPVTTTDATLASFITPTEQFFRIDTAFDSIPSIDANTWKLRIHGMVDKEVTLTMADLANMPQVEHVITLGCVSNPVGGEEIGTAKWGGVLLADVLRLAGVDPNAQQLVSRSHDGWTCGSPVNALMDGRPAMLVTSMNGAPLTAKHGFPVRMVVPGLFGYVSATKWLTEMELTTWDAFDAYWVVNGWAQQAPMLSSSRIDVPRENARVRAQAPVRVGGFAWAPRSGVGTVQVRVDGGEWNDAVIGLRDTGDAWAEWSWDWTPVKGQRQLQVRCKDADGIAQDEVVRPTEPSGATGLHSITIQVV